MTSAQHIRNLLKVYDQTTPEELADALASYQRYHDLIAEVASQTDVPVRMAAGVFAALSPNNSYVSNLRNCRTLLKVAKEGGMLESFRVNTYNSNKQKAWYMAVDNVDPLALLKGLKTKAFFLNILDPKNPEPVTVDGHMYWVWMGRKGVVKTRGFEGMHGRRPVKKAPVEKDHGPELEMDTPVNAPKAKPERRMRSRKEDAPPHLAPKMYADIADGIRFVAELRGVIPCQAQAVLWQTWRRLHNVMGSAQGELLARDVFAAGNHHHAHATKGCGQ